MKKTLILIYSIIMCCLLSCKKDPDSSSVHKEDDVRISFNYTIDTPFESPASEIPASDKELVDNFHKRIESGELLASTYSLSLVNINDGTEYYFSGNWRGQTPVTIRTGKYDVTGHSTAEGVSIQDRCSIIFKEQVNITGNSSAITLHGIYDCALIIFTDSDVESLINFNGEEQTPFFTHNICKYAFAKNQLYTYSKKDEAYISGTYTNGKGFQIKTDFLELTKGNYYVYNDIDADFGIPPMDEEEEEEDNENEGDENPDAVTINIPPDNEIWYTSTTGEPIELTSYPYELVSNTYENRTGKYRFKEAVVNIGSYFSDLENPKDAILKFTSLTLPSKIEYINAYFALGYLHNASALILPENLKSIGTDFIGGFGEDLAEKHLYFLSAECPQCSGASFWNQNSTLYVHYPEGADYSIVEDELKRWKQAHNDFKYELVETEYKLVHHN